jgi:hypothetical protein
VINPRLLVATNHLGWIEHGRDNSVQPDSRNDEEGGPETEGAHALGVKQSFPFRVSLGARKVSLKSLQKRSNQ